MPPEPANRLSGTTITGPSIDLNTTRKIRSTNECTKSKLLSVLHSFIDLPAEITYKGIAVPDQRRARRYELALPLDLVRAGSKHIFNSLETKNLSSGGVLFLQPEENLEIGQPVEYHISLPVPALAGPVRLRCMGKVVRRDDSSGAVAATLERYEFIRG